MARLFDFRPWPLLELEFDRREVNRFFFRVAQEGAQAFRAGMDGPHKGRLYSKRGRFHQASLNRARAEFPASDTGALRKTIKGRSDANSATVGSNMYYSRFLRQGTRRMRPRKMSVQALDIGIANVRGADGFRAWLRWKRLRQ